MTGIFECVRASILIHSKRLIVGDNKLMKCSTNPHHCVMNERKEKFTNNWTWVAFWDIHRQFLFSFRYLKIVERNLSKSQCRGSSSNVPRRSLSLKNEKSKWFELKNCSTFVRLLLCPCTWVSHCLFLRPCRTFKFHKKERHEDQSH